MSMPTSTGGDGRRSTIATTLLGWHQWQLEVLGLLRNELRGILDNIRLDDVDWLSWQAYYHEGRSPRRAVDRALERDL